MNNFPFSKDLLEMAPQPPAPRQELNAISTAPIETIKIIGNIKTKKLTVDFLNRLVSEGVLPELKKATILEKIVALVESENQ